MRSPWVCQGNKVEEPLGLLREQGWSSIAAPAVYKIGLGGELSKRVRLYKKIFKFLKFIYFSFLLSHRMCKSLFGGINLKNNGFPLKIYLNDRVSDLNFFSGICKMFIANNI